MAKPTPTSKAAPPSKSARPDLSSVPASWSQALTSVLLVIIFYELVWQLDFFYKPIVTASMIIVFMAIIAINAFRFGVKPALVVALIANIYTIYAYAGPTRSLAPINSLLRAEWLALVLFYAPAIIIGYLRERVDESIFKERQARSMAEQEQLRLTTILQQLPVGVVIAEASSGKVIFGNQYLEQLLSSTHTPVRDESEAVPLQEWPMRQVIEGQTLQSEEFTYNHAGHDHVLRVSGTPIYNSLGEITAGVVIIDDITVEKELQQRKDDFLSMVSHELKTPLTSLKMYIQLASRQIREDNLPASASLVKANAQADKLTQMIADMLSLARTQSGKLEYRFEPVDVAVLAKQVINDIQPTIPTHQLVLQAKPVPAIMADPDRITQVLINLITNAVKYSPQADKVIIDISSVNKQIQLSVQDFGIGIKSDAKKRIFERFYQAEQRQGQTFPGLGIGLYLCSEIVKQHHGKIWLESKYGSGSTFFVSLPFKQPKVSKKG